MGIPGAGKSRVAQGYVARGYHRLNRDERGGSLRGIAEALDDRLSSGARRVVLDNTYLTRAARSHVLETAARHGVPTRCVWLDTPLAQAQVNLVERLLERLGSLPSPDELKGLSRREPGVMAPTSQMRALRELEPPGDDEGFASVNRIPFERAPRSTGARASSSPPPCSTRPGGRRWWSARTLPRRTSSSTGVPRDRRRTSLAEAHAPVDRLVSGPVEAALCPHGAGPPTCWCRPPLPGLLLAFARSNGVDPSLSTLIGTSAAHRTLATTLGARHVGH